MENIASHIFGHDNPMYDLLRNQYTQAWRRIGAETGSQKALFRFRFTWFVPGIGVTISTSSRTIHDFDGFPKELHQV